MSIHKRSFFDEHYHLSAFSCLLKGLKTNTWLNAEGYDEFLSSIEKFLIFSILKEKNPKNTHIENPTRRMILMKPVNLVEHPEGGRFCEVFRSAETVTTYKGDTRSALTHIYFSLKPGEKSRFHKVASDEVWNLYQGSGLNLYIWDGSDNPPECITLSADSNNFCHVVPAKVWQAAEPASDTALVGCSVAPGFEFTDFTLIDPESGDAGKLISLDPDMKRFIKEEVI